MVLFVDDVTVSKGMVKYVSALTKESVLDIEGTIAVPSTPITGCSVPVELAACVVRCVSRAAGELPFQMEDAARPDAEVDAPDSPFPRVLGDTRLDNRVLDLRTPANHAIFRLQSAVGGLFREALAERGFIEIHTPKLIAGASEGGASVFKLSYMGTPACLAQSPQLYKQVCGVSLSVCLCGLHAPSDARARRRWAWMNLIKTLSARGFETRERPKKHICCLPTEPNAAGALPLERAPPRIASTGCACCVC